MAREIDLIGYSKGVDDFIYNGMSMQRTIPYSGDDTRVHHEQKLLPGLSIGGGDVGAYDGPFAVKWGDSYSDQRSAIMQGGNVYAGTNVVRCGGISIDPSDFPCYVIVRVTYIEKVYRALLFKSRTVPLPVDNYWEKVLAYIEENKITQWWQGGDIYVAGRCV